MVTPVTAFRGWGQKRKEHLDRKNESMQKNEVK
jgi:hypothetical protein